MNKNILNSRELQERLDELQSEFPVWLEQMEDEEKILTADAFGLAVDEMKNEDWREAWEGTSDGEEWANINSLKEEINSSEWQHGLTLIADSYFEEYAREFAEDIGAISGNERWPANCIDWEKAASELKYDYSSVEFDGETYWYRE